MTSSSFFQSNNESLKFVGSPSQYVKLNVGGSLHYTTIGTLTKHDTMLRAMFSGRMEVLTDSEGMKNVWKLSFWNESILHILLLTRLGWILIDRSGKHFGTILNFLRDGSAPLPESPREIAELLAEAKYYCVAELGNSSQTYCIILCELSIT